MHSTSLIRLQFTPLLAFLILNWLLYLQPHYVCRRKLPMPSCTVPSANSVPLLRNPEMLALYLFDEILVRSSRKRLFSTPMHLLVHDHVRGSRAHPPYRSARDSLAAHWLLVAPYGLDSSLVPSPFLRSNADSPSILTKMQLNAAVAHRWAASTKSPHLVSLSGRSRAGSPSRRTAARLELHSQASSELRLSSSSSSGGGT